MMPIRPYIAPLIAVTGATRQMTCLIETISATSDYMDWHNTNPTTSQRKVKIKRLQEQEREQTEQTTYL